MGSSLGVNVTLLNNIKTDTEEIIEIGETVEHHFHNTARYLGLAVSPSGTTHRADKVGPSVTSFQLDAGNDDWSGWTQVVGSTDTPVQTGKLYFDFHKLLVTASERTASYFIQICFSTGAGTPTGEATLYTTIGYQAIATNGRSSAIEFRSPVVPVGTKCWARTICIGQDTGTINFYIGIHEYVSVEDYTTPPVILPAP